MEEYCGSRFWDLNITWYSDFPIFTTCFERTILVWIPFLFLTVSVGVDLCASARSGKQKAVSIPWNPLSVAKVIFCGLLLVLELFRLLSGLRAGNFTVYAVDIYSPTLKFLSFVSQKSGILAMGLVLRSRRKGMQSSAVQFFYWILLSLCELPTFTRMLSTIGDKPAIDTVLIEAIYYPVIVGEFLLQCWSDISPMVTHMKGHPEESASTLNRLLFCWFDSLAWTGYRKILTTDDLWGLKRKDAADFIVKTFESKLWNVSDDDPKPRRAVLLHAVRKVFGGALLYTVPLKLAEVLLKVCTPNILHLVIGFVTGDEELWKGYLYASLLLLLPVMVALCRAHHDYQANLIANRVGSAVSTAVYKKSLAISQADKQGSMTGEATTLISVDRQKIVDVIPFINTLWSAPLQLCLVIYFLWNLLGPSALAGVGVIFLLTPFNSLLLGKFLKKYSSEQMHSTETRMKHVSEILRHIRTLKFYVWEEIFQNKVLEARRKEIKSLRSMACVNAINDLIFSSSQFLVTWLSIMSLQGGHAFHEAAFATYVLIDERNILDPETAFVSLALLNMLTIPLDLFPRVLTRVIQANVSFQRLSTFLNSEEIDSSSVRHDAKAPFPIILNGASFTWVDDGQNILESICLKIKDGALVAIVGAVGSGKSSMLAAILGEMHKTAGEINTRGKIAYVAQEAWIQNATLRDNIVFGKPFEALRYEKAVQACALGPDLATFAGRDAVEIGEKGINLSGGQKQRLSLARAVYNNADVYLLDDPLSAVDSLVGRDIFENVIGPAGLLKEKTRLLVTHSVEFLNRVDFIIVLKNGQIAEAGSYVELIQNKGEFASVLSEYTAKKLNIPKSLDDIQVDRENAGHSEEEKAASDSQEGDKLIREEKSENEGAPWSLYWSYFRGCGCKLLLPAILASAFYQSFAVFGNLWLTVWSEESVTYETRQSPYFYIGIYSAFGIFQSLSSFIGAFLICLASLHASSVFHEKMLNRILRAPILFFDTTPTGRLLNRFSKDVDILDNKLSENVRSIILCGFNAVGAITVIAYTVPLFSASLVPLLIIYYLLQKFYIPTSRQLRRLESVARSPIYSHLSETISGLTTVRAYSDQNRFLWENHRRVDEHQICSFASCVASRWILLRLDIMGALITFFTAIFAVMNRDTLSPGVVGLAVTYAIDIVGYLNYAVHCLVDMGTNIVAVERIKEFQLVAQEGPRYSLRRPPKPWPHEGKVQFENYHTRYREGLDYALKAVTCCIQPGEHIGIVGRTGAGKSSITLALFRMIEPLEGSIIIDGENISKIGLHDLRSKLTIIPQDPTVFSGTIRFNLDPRSCRPDEELWRAIELAHLKDFVESLPGQLEYSLTDGGDNLSVGQKQLLCLARAVMRKSKILILDEATAAVDSETEKLIRATVRTEFADSTVITISHRPRTVMDSKRMMVIENGTVVEFDSPVNMLKNPVSRFHNMAYAFDSAYMQELLL